MDVAERLKELMEERDLNINSLSKKSGVPWNTIKNFYVRKTVPNVITIAQLCKGLGITLAQFFDVEGKTINLTAEQQYFLQRWDAITDNEKRIIGDLLDDMLANRK